jgi:Do/DeqQ family serine protease
MTVLRPHRFALIALIAVVSSAPAQDRVVGPMPSLAPLIDKVAPAVVNISVVELVDASAGRGRGPRGPRLPDDFFNGPPGSDDEPDERNGAGSGVIVDAEHGYVITNHHVVENASEIRVVLVDNRSFEGRVVGSDSRSDLAVLQIDGDDLTAIPFTPSDDLKVGDYVVAIGNPFGFSNTVTSGIVSGLGRQFVMSDDVYEDFIQTDASINPGNSGGALINLRGELVGVNSAIISPGFGGGNVGIGFAIPSRMVVSVMDRLLEFGIVRRGLLGVVMDSITPSFAADYGLPVTAGALVMEVMPDSAAEAAGILVNDVIVGIDGARVADGNELRNRVAMRLPGDLINVDIVRGERERSLQATLKSRPDEVAQALPSREQRQKMSALDGVELAAERQPTAGLRVLSIDSGSAAADRLYQGDLITAVNQRSVGDVARARELADETRTVVLEIERNARKQLIRIR